MSNVVEFRRREPGDPDDEPLVKKEPAQCRHRKRVLDAEARTVHCRECGQLLDPFWCLLNAREFQEALDRKLKTIREFEARQQERQQRAIKHAMRERRRRGPPADNCAACRGTGWKDTPQGMVPCPCKKTGIPQIL